VGGLREFLYRRNALPKLLYGYPIEVLVYYDAALEIVVEMPLKVAEVGIGF